MRAESERRAQIEAEIVTLRAQLQEGGAGAMRRGIASVESLDDAGLAELKAACEEGVTRATLERARREVEARMRREVEEREARMQREMEARLRQEMAARGGGAGGATADDDSRLCEICMERPKCIVLNCGHPFCRQCVAPLHTCPNCRADITARTRVFL